MMRNTQQCKYNEIFYSERQRFRQWWLWTLLMIIPTISIWAMFQQFIMGAPFGNNPASNYLLIILVAITGIGFPMFMYITGLDTQVRHCGLYIRFKPFHRKWMIFEFENMQKVEPVIYKPLMDYGGFGIRYGKKGKAYNVSGNKGVFLTLKNGKTILIGSNNHEVLYSAITEKLSSTTMVAVQKIQQ